MLQYDEYAIFKHYSRELQKVEKLVKQDVAQRANDSLQRSVQIISTGKGQFAHAFHQMNYYASYLSQYDNGKIRASNILSKDYPKSSHYAKYLQALTRKQAVQLKIDRIDQYLQLLGNDVDNIIVSDYSVSTYVQLSSQRFQNKSSTDLKRYLIRDDYFAGLPDSQQLLRKDIIKLRISDHYPFDYARRCGFCGDIDLIMKG